MNDEVYISTAVGCGGKDILYFVDNLKFRNK